MQLDTTSFLDQEPQLPVQSPRPTRRSASGLTDAALRNLKTEPRPYKVFDGNSLFIYVTPSGLRAWRFKYTFGGKEKLLALGSYPQVSLATARRKRDDARAKLADGVDPMEERRSIKLALRTAADDSFETVALAWHAQWCSDHHQRYANQVLRRLKADAFPVLGGKRISDIRPPEVVRVLERMAARGALDTARKMKYTLGQIFRSAVVRGLANADPTGGFKPSDVLASRSVRHHARIEEKDLPLLLGKIDAYQGTALTRLALRLLASTFVRTSELIDAKWAEIDFARSEWKIPAERMKKRRIHVVPLSRQSLQDLRTLHLISGKSELLFPGDRDPHKPMSNNTILKALERMGFAGVMTGHGFRGLASTYLYEQQFAGDLVELQLAHVKGKVRGAYDHSQQLPARRDMLQHWADFLDQCRASVGVGDSPIPTAM